MRQASTTHGTNSPALSCSSLWEQPPVAVWILWGLVVMAEHHSSERHRLLRPTAGCFHRSWRTPGGSRGVLGPSLPLLQQSQTNKLKSNRGAGRRDPTACSHRLCFLRKLGLKPGGFGGLVLLSSPHFLAGHTHPLFDHPALRSLLY